MATGAYVMLWMMAQVLAFMLGAISHYVHANMSMPEKLIDGDRVRDHVLNGMVSHGYEWWADYDEMGFWKYDSWKNFLFHVTPPSVAVLALALYLFPQRVEMVQSFCSNAASVGFVPRYCPAQ